MAIKLIYAIQLSELREYAVKFCDKIKCRNENQVSQEIKEIEYSLIKHHEDEENKRRSNKLEQLYDELILIKDCERAKNLINLADTKKNTGNFAMAECYYNKAIFIMRRAGHNG